MKIGLNQARLKHLRLYKFHDTANSKLTPDSNVEASGIADRATSLNPLSGGQKKKKEKVRRIKKNTEVDERKKKKKKLSR